MRDYQRRVLKDARYTTANGCGQAALCPALSLPDLFQGDAAADRAKVAALLDAVPPYFSQAVITADRQTANLAFGIRLVPLDEQQRVIDRMRDAARPAAGRDRAARGPAGARGRGERRAGVAVAAARDAARRAAGGRRSCCCSSTGARRARWCRSSRSRSPPAGRRSCCSLLRIPLNPMSATLGALVIAISTEFAVLLDAPLPRGAGARARAGRRAARDLPLDRRGRARLGRDRDRRASPCWRSPTCGCCGASGSSRSSTCRSRCSACSPCCPRCSCWPSGAPARRAARRRARRAERSRRAGVKGGWRSSCVVAVARGSALHHLNTLHDRGARARRARDGAAAVRDAARDLRLGGDANVATKPGQDQLGPVPACDVRGPTCSTRAQLAERGPVVLAFVVTGVGECDAAGRRARPGAPGSYPDVRVRRGRRAGGPRRPARARSGRAAGRCRSATTTTGVGNALRLRRRLPAADVRRRARAGRGDARRGARRGGADGARAGAGGGAAAVVSGRDPELVAAAVDPLVAAEHPGPAGLDGARAGAARGGRRRSCASGCALLADRLRGREAIALRTRPVPQAYRVLFRHLGLDPDVTRTPVEALVARAAAARRLRGARAARGRARARDAGDRRRGLGARRGRPPARSRCSDRRGRPARAVRRPRHRHASLFSPPPPERAPGRGTTALLLVAVQAPGVDDLVSRRRCGRRPPRYHMTRRHDHPSLSRARRAAHGRSPRLAAPASAHERRPDAALRVRPRQDRAGPEHDRVRPERAQARRPTAASPASSRPDLQGRQRPARRRHPPAPRRLAHQLRAAVRRRARRRRSSRRPRLRLALPDDGPVAHEPHDPQPHADARRRSTSPTTSTSSPPRRRRGEHAGRSTRSGSTSWAACLSRVRRQARPPTATTAGSPTRTRRPARHAPATPWTVDRRTACSSAPRATCTRAGCGPT